MTTYEAETQLDAYMGQLNTDVADFDNTAKAMGAAVTATTENFASRIRVVSYLPLGGIFLAIFLFVYHESLLSYLRWYVLLGSIGGSIALIIKDLTRGKRMRASLKHQQLTLDYYIDNN